MSKVTQSRNTHCSADLGTGNSKPKSSPMNKHKFDAKVATTVNLSIYFSSFFYELVCLFFIHSPKSAFVVLGSSLVLAVGTLISQVVVIVKAKGEPYAFKAIVVMLLSSIVGIGCFILCVYLMLTSLTDLFLGGFEFVSNFFKNN